MVHYLRDMSIAGELTVRANKWAQKKTSKRATSKTAALYLPR
jgi:hypothetical protein